MEKFIDKCRKRGIRIAQKSTYKHHERDHFTKPHSWRGVLCWRHDDHLYYRGCPGCLKYRYWKGDEPALDHDLKDYLDNSGYK